mmetsp:Transcript_20540/g.59482  ORF Transcript_20540/g.59482 Transcript_20540/m.59482 type:complete len:558 (-) Transcript_20540:238-1911(-)
MDLALMEVDRAAVLQALGGYKQKHELVEALQMIGRRGEMNAMYYEYTGDVVGMLRHHDPEVVAAACEALGNLGQAAESYVGEIAMELDSQTPEVRAAAATSVGLFGPAALPHVEKLEHIMKNDIDEAAKCAAIGALGQIGAESQAGDLAQLLEDESPVVVAAACQAIGELGGAGEAQAAKLAAKLDDPRVRYAAICALSNLGESACDKFIEDIISKCLSDKDSQTRTTAAEAIGSVAETVLNTKGDYPAKIAELLKHEDAGIRCSAAMAFGYMGDKASSFANSIKPLLGDKNEDTSELYLTIGGGSMRSPPSSRRPACAALAALGMMGAEALADDCADCLNEDQWEVKMCALECLAQLGDAGKSQSSKITTCLEDDVFVVRTKACECLGALKAEDGLHSVPELFEDKAPTVRAAALLALAEVEDVAQGYSNEVFKCMNDQIQSVQAAAITCLGSMGETGQSYASIIATKLYDEDAGVRAAACEALGKLGDYGAAFAEEVAACIQDGSPDVRMRAVQALGKMGNEGSPFLSDIQYLMNDPFGEVSSAAKEVVMALEAE